MFSEQFDYFWCLYIYLNIHNKPIYTYYGHLKAFAEIVFVADFLSTLKPKR